MNTKTSTKTLVLGSLGVVFGDIGTSPLYSLKECFAGQKTANPEMILGVISLIIWTLLLIVSVKYVSFIMRADKQGEGGILTLLSIATEKIKSTRTKGILTIIGIAGAALLFGDGMITPAISVLSAVEGITLLNANLHAWVVPITLGILITLFAIQKAGTEKVGKYFGPITLIWFSILGISGIYWALQAPEILKAFNPIYGIQLAMRADIKILTVLGGVFLAVTGGEALYADMGHFGKKPIKIAWYAIVFPALILNYFGQGAYLLQHPEVLHEDASILYKLFPTWALIPMIALAGAATVIASQALITGTFSLTLQGIHMGYIPRLKVRHTNPHTHGQIYIPVINWALMFSCLILVIAFKSSAALASAYGIAVTLTMLTTTFLFFFTATTQWNWSPLQAAALTGSVSLLEGIFFLGNSEKILEGGWVPLFVGGILFLLMTTWKTGRKLVSENLESSSLTQELFIESIHNDSRVQRVTGTAVFMGKTPGMIPHAILHNLKHNHVLHERVIFLTIITENTPFICPNKQVEITEIAPGFIRMHGHYGFMQEPNIPQLFRRAEHHANLEMHVGKTTYFLGREVITPSPKPGMSIWREHLFAFLTKMAEAPGSFFHLAESRTMEIGIRVSI
jgi:KUP system potassium uptake protein